MDTNFGWTARAKRMRFSSTTTMHRLRRLYWGERNCICEFRTSFSRQNAITGTRPNLYTIYTEVLNNSEATSHKSKLIHDEFHNARNEDDAMWSYTYASVVVGEIPLKSKEIHQVSDVRPSKATLVKLCTVCDENLLSDI